MDQHLDSLFNDCAFRNSYSCVSHSHFNLKQAGSRAETLSELARPSSAGNRFGHVGEALRPVFRDTPQHHQSWDSQSRSRSVDEQTTTPPRKKTRDLVTPALASTASTPALPWTPARASPPALEFETPCMLAKARESDLIERDNSMTPKDEEISINARLELSDPNHQ